jgi:hypothetical protein
MCSPRSATVYGRPRGESDRDTMTDQKPLEKAWEKLSSVLPDGMMSSTQLATIKLCFFEGAKAYHNEVFTSMKSDSDGSGTIDYDVMQAMIDELQEFSPREMLD